MRTDKFLSQYKPYLGRFAAVMACAFASAAASLVFPLGIRRISQIALDAGAQGAGQRIVEVSLLMLVVALLDVCFSFGYDYFGHALGARMENDLRQEVFEHMQKLSFGFFDRHRVGSLMSNLTNDLLNLTELYHHGPEDYIISFVKFIGAAVILLLINWRLALVVLAFVPVMVIFTVFAAGRVRRASRANLGHISDINAQAEDVLSGIRVVQSFTNQKHENRRFLDLGRQFFHSRRAIYLQESIHDKGMLFLSRGVLLATVLASGLYIMRGEMGVSDLLAFILYIGYLTDPIQRIAWMTTQFQVGLAGFDRVMDILETEPEIKDRPNAKRAEHIRGRIDFQQVVFVYANDLKPVLCNLDLSFSPGEYAAIVGYSGVGKTTLCSLIPRFYEPVSGRILLDGTDIKDLTLESLRRNVALVPQDVYLFAGTIAENIRYGRTDATMEEIVAAAMKANAHDFITALPDGYDTDVGPKGVRLSGGQKQRISIARAFLKDAPVLILDEATSSLDNESEKAVYDALEKLRGGRTTLVIAHRLSTIHNAQRILVLSEQGIVEDGTHESLMAQDGVYARLYASLS